MYSAPLTVNLRSDLLLGNKDQLEVEQNEAHHIHAHVTGGPNYLANFKPVEGTLAMD